MGENTQFVVSKGCFCHNHLPFIIINGSEGARKILKVTMYESISGSSINQIHYRLFISGGAVDSELHRLQWPSTRGNLGLLPLSRAWEAPIPNKSVSLRPLLEQMGHHRW